MEIRDEEEKGVEKETPQNKEICPHCRYLAFDGGSKGENIPEVIQSSGDKVKWISQTQPGKEANQEDFKIQNGRKRSQWVFFQNTSWGRFGRRRIGGNIPILQEGYSVFSRSSKGENVPKAVQSSGDQVRWVGQTQLRKEVNRDDFDIQNGRKGS